ncbi:MAG: hypothetical protein KatS3mg031_0056 [Chitinophagales bacterium]|nr:MAG: hypothetical protein KatS3mg031_0056 [Chitinophagales bacterium]
MNLNVMLYRATVFICLWAFAGADVNAAVYSTIQQGAFDQTEIWSPQYPGNIIKENDTLLISHEIRLNADLLVKGTLIIEESASLIGLHNVIVVRTGTVINLGNMQVDLFTNRGAFYNRQHLEVITDFVNSGNIINHKDITVSNVIDNTGIMLGKGGSITATNKFINSRTGQIKGYLNVCSNNFLNVEGGVIDTQTTTFCGNPVLGDQGLLSQAQETLQYKRNVTVVHLRTGEYKPF